jgi:inorganic triphosphatase YgiF
VELKFEFDPADAALLASHPALEPSLTPPQEQQLVSIYFDTPDCGLHQSGVYLRIRENGGLYVQTIKAARSKAELIERLEWEREISGRSPDLDGAQGTPLQALLTPKVRASLQPMFETRIRRNICLIGLNGSEIEVAIDRGEIATRTHTRPVCELELELKRGKTRALFRLARDLAETVPLRFAVKTKAERGYELVQDGGRKLEKATEIDIAPELTAGEAFRAIALSCLRQIIANEPAMCAGQAEALHQMRIGLRRLRAANAIFAEIVGGEDLRKIKPELKWITRELGRARDLDVIAGKVPAPLRAGHSEDEEIAVMHRDFEERRAAAHASAAASVRSRRFRHFVLDLVEWIETGPWAVDKDKERKKQRTRAVAKHAERELARLRKRIKRTGADLRHRSVQQRHRLRIRAKCLRYATEFFASTFPGGANAKRRSESLSALKDLQDALGGLNDLAKRPAMVAPGLRGDAGEAEKPVLDARPVAPDTQAETLLLNAEQAFARFAEAKAFWKA